MKYTRKTFIDVSEILNKFSDRIDSHDFNDLVFEFSELFFEDNPNFDESRFEQACLKKSSINA
jgi:hypothetical protein